MANIIGEAAYKVRADTTGFQREAEGGIGKGMLGLATKLGAGFAAFKVFEFAKDSIIGFNSTLEQSKTAFTTLLGGAKPATKAISELQQFAVKTPFAFKELLPVAQQLLGTGTKLGDLTPVMTRLGDAVSSTGGTSADLSQLTLAYTQMSTSGKANLQDLMQINNAVPGTLSRMAEAGGMSIGQFREKVSAGMVSSKEAVDLFNKATSKVGGAMEAQSHTFAGSMSNIQDALQQTLAKVGAPLFDFIAGKAQVFAEELGKLGGIFDNLQSQFGTAEALKGVFITLASDIGVPADATKALLDAFSAIGDAISFLADQFNQNSDTIKQLLIGFGIGVGIFTALSVAISLAAGAFALLTSPIVIIGALAAAIYFLYQNNETFRAAVQSAFEWLQANVPPVIQGIIDNFNQLRDTFQPIIEAVINFMTTNQTFLNVIQTVWNLVLAIISNAILQIQGIINIVMGILTGDWGRAWQGIQQVVQAAFGTIRAIMGAAVSILGQIALSIVTAIIGKFTSLAGRVIGFFADLVSGALGKLRGFISSAGSAAADIVTGIIGKFTGIGGKVVSKLADFGSGIQNKLSSVASSALGWAADIGRSITDGVKNGLGDLKGAVEDWVSDAVSDLNPFSPVEHGGAKYIGEPLMAGAIAGIESLTPALNAAIVAAMPSTGASGTVDAGTTNNRTVNVGQVILPTVTNGGDLVRQLDALVARPG
jgi:tape measure domain-containing protein